jgi:hypothetical protein
MKKLLILLGAASIASCNSNQKSNTGDTTKSDTTKSTTVTTTTTKSTTAVDSSKIWTYLADTDKMTSKLTYQASVNSLNKINFDAPYDGGSTASVIIRNKAGKNEVMLSIDKGQFICDVSDGCAINIRFDNDPAIKFVGSEPSDGSSTLLFIEAPKKFIADVKKAKKMIVQAEFYQSGLKDMEFNVDGLKWDH